MATIKSTMSDDAILHYYNADDGDKDGLRAVADKAAEVERIRIYNFIRLLSTGSATDYEIHLLRLIAANKL